MYRVLILLSAFLLAVSGLLFMQGEGRDPVDLADARLVIDDLRDMAAPSSTDVEAVVGAALAMTALEDAVNATGAPPAQTPEGDTLAALTSGVLAGLGSAPATIDPAVQAPVDEAMRDATNDVLAALMSGQGIGPSGTNLEALVAQSMRLGQDSAYMDALLNEAVASGQVVAPGALMTEDGRLDTRTLRASIDAQGSGTSGPRAEAQVINGQRFYTVEAGDSLAYIAMKFFGSTAAVDRIFEANQSVLSTPDELRIGQKLLIPG